MKISKVKSANCLALLILIFLCTNIVLAESLPNQDGVFYYPNTLTDIRDINFVDNAIALTAVADDGNIYTTFYQGNSSHCLGTHYFESASVDDISNQSLDNVKGTYYIVDGATDVRGVNIVGSSIVVAARTDEGDVVLYLYESGNSYFESLHVFHSTDGSNSQEELNEGDYIPEEATDLIDFQMIGTNMIFTGKQENGDLAMISYKPEPVYEYFKIKPYVEIENLSNKEGTYYIPEEVGDVTEVEINEQEITIFFKVPSGDLALLTYNKGISLPVGMAQFAVLPGNTVDNRELPVKDGTYYVADILTTDLVNTAIDNEHDIIYLLSKLEDRLILTAYHIGDSYPAAYLIFLLKEPELCI